MLDLATRIQTAAKPLGLAVEVSHIQNPRKEKEDHYYHANNTNLISLGLQPVLLSDAILTEMIELVLRQKSSIRHEYHFARQGKMVLRISTGEKP